MTMSTILDKIKCGELKRIKSSGSSDVWRVFDKIVNNDSNETHPFVICTECEKIFKYGKGCSPSNLRKHACFKQNNGGFTQRLITLLSPTTLLDVGDFCLPLHQEHPEILSDTRAETNNPIVQRSSNIRRRRKCQEKKTSWAVGKTEQTDLQREAHERKLVQEMQHEEELFHLKVKHETLLFEAKLREIENRITLDNRRFALEQTRLGQHYNSGHSTGL